MIGDNFDFNNLELYGSIIYCIQTLKKYGEDFSYEKVLQELRSWKKEKYDPSQVKEAYDTAVQYLQ
jgi:hypothetical protein